MSPLEIPGKPFGRLPDKRSKGDCPHCYRSYRSLIVKWDEDSRKARHYCPYCGEEVSEDDDDEDS